MSILKYTGDGFDVSTLNGDFIGRVIHTLKTETNKGIDLVYRTEYSVLYTLNTRNSKYILLQDINCGGIELARYSVGDSNSFKGLNPFPIELIEDKLKKILEEVSNEFNIKLNELCSLENIFSN